MHLENSLQSYSSLAISAHFPSAKNSKDTDTSKTLWFIWSLGQQNHVKLLVKQEGLKDCWCKEEGMM